MAPRSKSAKTTAVVTPSNPHTSKPSHQQQQQPKKRQSRVTTNKATGDTSNASVASDATVPSGPSSCEGDCVLCKVAGTDGCTHCRKSLTHAQPAKKRRKSEQGTQAGLSTFGITATVTSTGGIASDATCDDTTILKDFNNELDKLGVGRCASPLDESDVQT